MSRSIILIFVAACGSSSTSTPPPAKPEPAPATTPADAQNACVTSFTHSRTCTDLYIPALVDMRAKLDMPKGITEEVKKDRDGVIAKAKTEWASDSTDENIAKHCEQMTANLPDSARPLIDEVRACEAQTECAAYVACMQPVQEKLMTQGPAHP